MHSISVVTRTRAELEREDSKRLQRVLNILNENSIPTTVVADNFTDIRKNLNQLAEKYRPLKE